MSSVIFRVNGRYQHRIRFGETATLIQACYFRGKELGYDDIYMEWPLKSMFSDIYGNRINIKCPPNELLPIKFIHRLEFNKYQYNKNVGLDEYNSFYKDSPPVFEKNKTCFIGFYSFLNKYYLETGKKPIFNIKKDKLDKPYIIFHFRWSNNHSPERNPRVSSYMKIFNMIKEKYGNKYEIWKSGEPNKMLERKCDKTIPYYNDNLNEQIKVINNSSLVVSPGCGIEAYCELVDKPLLYVEASQDNIGGTFDKQWWKNNGGKHGEMLQEWRIGDRLHVLWKQNEVDRDEIFKFMDRWL